MNDIRRNIEELRIKEFNLNKNTEEDQGSSIGLIRELLAGVVSKEIKQEDFVNKENTNSEEDKEKELDYQNLNKLLYIMPQIFNNIREIERYINSISLGIYYAKRELDICDYLSINLIKFFETDLYNYILKSEKIFFEKEIKKPDSTIHFSPPISNKSQKCYIFSCIFG